MYYYMKNMLIDYLKKLKMIIDGFIMLKCKIMGKYTQLNFLYAALFILLKIWFYVY